MKSADRALSKKVHPDKNRAEGSTEAFKKLQEAYKSLLERGGGDEESQRDDTEEENFKDSERSEAEEKSEERRKRKDERKRKRDENRFFFQLLKSRAVFFLALAVVWVVTLPKQPALETLREISTKKSESQMKEIEELKTQAQLLQHCSSTKVTYAGTAPLTSLL